MLYYTEILFCKKKLSIFGHRPNFIINQKFQLITMISNNLKEWFYFIAVRKGLFFSIFYLIRLFSSLDHLGNSGIHFRNMLADLFDQPHLLPRIFLKLRPVNIF